jgi:transcriptional regulator with XRE-family HTH domain
MARAKPKELKPPDLADQLRQAVAGCGMSLNQLAKATGVHQAQLSRFLRKERSLQLTAAAKLCAYLGLRLTGPALDKKA